MTTKSSHFHLFFFFTICLYLNSFGQNKHTVEGFYTTMNKDTVKGSFTHYKEWNNNPATVDFIAENSNAPIILKPDSVAYLYLSNNEVYKGYTGKRLLNPIALTSAVDEIDSTDKPQEIAVFLRLLFTKDDLSFWILEDKNRINLFYEIDSQQGMQELIYKRYANNENNITNITTYKNQLTTLLYGRSTIQSLDKEITLLDYNENAFVKFLRKCLIKGSPQKIKNKYPSRFFITAGISSNTLTGDGSEEFHQSKTTYNNTVSPLMSIGTFLYTQRGFGNFFVSPKITFYTYKHTGVYYLNDFAKTQYTYTYKSDLLLRPTINMGYTVLKKASLQWHLSLGAGFLLLINNKETTVMKSNYRTQTSEAKMKSLSYNINLETGLLICKNIILSANYSPKVNVTDFATASINHSSIQAMIGYIF